MKTRPTIKQRIDREVPGIGRVNLRTRARTTAEHNARKALFNRLVEADQLDVIRMLMRGEVSWIELRQAERKKRLHSDALAADVALARPLWDRSEAEPGALTQTLPRMGKAESSRERYRVAFVQLRAHAADFLPAGASVKHLATVDWPAVWDDMRAAELSAATRNRVRSSLSAFLTVFLGDKFHPFRREMMRLMGAFEDQTGQLRDITVDEFWTNYAKLDDAIKPIALTLAGSGLRVGEYLQCTETSARRLPTIWFPNGKTGGGEVEIASDLVPFARLAIPCRIAPAPKVWKGVQYDARYRKIHRAFAAAAKATGIPWSPHYLRHLYAQLGIAKLPDVVVQKGLRHKTASMTRHYADRKVKAEVSEAVSSTLLGAKSAPKKVRVNVRSRSRREAS